MKLAVEYPSVAFRKGPAMIAHFAKAIEDIRYDQLDVYDHVAMGFDIDGRDKSYYPAKMPVLEALMMLAFAAAVTEKIGLGTDVLVLPQRQPLLVAKQYASLDTLSGWQESEFEALGENFKDRGKRTDKAIEFLRACWRDERIDFPGEHYTANAMAMEPKPPQRADLPIWVGGNSPPAFRRVGKYGNGWLASRVTYANFASRAMDAIREAALAAGRDPHAIGWQSMIAPPPRAGDTKGKAFYAEPDHVVARAADLQAMKFDYVSLNATAIFQSGARSVEAILDTMQILHDRLRAELG